MMPERERPSDAREREAQRGRGPEECGRQSPGPVDTTQHGREGEAQ